MRVANVQPTAIGGLLDHHSHDVFSVRFTKIPGWSFCKNSGKLAYSREQKILTLNLHILAAVESSLAKSPCGRRVFNGN